MEIWKDITNYNGYYQVSNYGRVRSINRTVPNGKGTGTGVMNIQGKIISLPTHTGGYKHVTLHNGKRTMFFVHRLVLLEFVGNPPTTKHQCNHKNGIRTDNHVDNLEWVTHAENINHSFKELGRIASSQLGEANGRSKLTNETVLEIRELYATGNYLQKELANLFGVNQTRISGVITRKTWTHI